MSNLQILARRCPVMGKALAVQSARNGHVNFANAAYNGMRTYHTKTGRAKLHTTRAHEAQAVDVGMMHPEQGEPFN